MGEARKKKRKLLDRLQDDQPYCVFCGGETCGTTVDHLPPRIMFNQRHRPKGMEFLACEECNSSSSLDEQIVGLLCRMYPDAKTEEEQAEVRRLFQMISNNHPGLLEELRPSLRQRKAARKSQHLIPDDARGVFNANGPLLNHALSRFAAKMGLALHFHETGRIVPHTGLVTVRWYSNMEAFTGVIPDEFLRRLGPPKTLKQGKFEVPDQFLLSSMVSEKGLMSAHMATFRVSFAAVAFVAVDESAVHDRFSSNSFRPGFLCEVDGNQ